jgi:hypothetical protein
VVQKISLDLPVGNFTNLHAVILRDYLIAELKNTFLTANNPLMHLNTRYKHLKLRADIPESPFKVKKLKQEVTSKNIAVKCVSCRGRSEGVAKAFEAFFRINY